MRLRYAMTDSLHITNGDEPELPKLERASDADVADIVRLLNRAYRGEGEGWTTEAGIIGGVRTTESELRGEMALSPEGAMLLWREDEQLLGCVWLEPLGDDRWYLGSFAIDPAAQNLRLGRRMLAAAEAWAKAREACEIEMTVIDIRTELIDWYQRRGYRLTEERRPFPYGNENVGSPKRPDLQFVVLRKSLSDD